MWFKSIRLYRFTDYEQTANITLEALNNLLSRKPFTPCTAMQQRSFGFVRPRDSDGYAVNVAGRLLVQACIESKIIPAKAVNLQLQKKIAEVKANEDRAVGRKERQQMKEDIIAAILPTALTEQSVVNAWFDTERGWLAIGARSKTLADEFTAHLREAIGTLPVVPVANDTNCSVNLTWWLMGPAEAKPNFELQSPVRLAMKLDKSVRSDHRNLMIEDPIIQSGLNDGMQLMRVGINQNGSMQAVIDDDLVLSSIKYGEKLIEQSQESDDWKADAVLSMSAITECYESIFNAAPVFSF